MVPLAAIPKLRAGGLFILDNAEWFLPPARGVQRGPVARTPQQGPAGPHWESVSQTLANWPTIWTGDGVTNTLFAFKLPSAAANAGHGRY